MDQAFALLQPHLQNGSQACLLVADENLGDAPFSTIARQVEVISNRFDISHCAQAAGLKAQFNDFDFSGYPANHFARLCYRISKEKAVVEHVLGQASRVLQVDGQLILCGGKNEGLKRFARYAAQLMGSSAEIRKTGTLYTACIVKHGKEADARAPVADYSRSLPIQVDLDALGLAPLHGQTAVTLCSKAGMFGAGRIDEGSAMLAASLPAFLQALTTRPTTCSTSAAAAVISASAPAVLVLKPSSPPTTAPRQSRPVNKMQAASGCPLKSSLTTAPGQSVSSLTLCYAIPLFIRGLQSARLSGNASSGPRPVT